MLKKYSSFILFLILIPQIAFADFEGSLGNLVNSVLGRIFPLFALYFAGEAALSWIQNRPDAKDKAQRVAIGAVALLGINGLWSWVISNIR